MTDQRSKEAEVYRQWYGSAQWKALRRHQLSSEPLCKFCMDVGIVTIAAICDHVEPHKGNPAKFWGGPFQSLCKPHHDAAKQRDEDAGFSHAVGEDGWPLDPRHPANASPASRRDRSAITQRGGG